MNQTQPEPIIWENFSPTIMQLEVPEKFVSIVNTLGDAVLSDNVLSAKFDFSHGLVGKVSKEVKIPAYDKEDTKFLGDTLKKGCLQYLNYMTEKKRLAKAAGRRRWLKKIDKLKETGQWND